MKRYISFLSVLSIILSAGYARASECFGEDCDFEVPTFSEETFTEEDILQPVEHSENLWVETSSEDLDDSDEEIEEDTGSNVKVVEVSSDKDEIFCEYDDNCPFDTAAECAIWNQKPIYKTSVAPRAPHLNPVKTDGILYTLLFKGGISTEDEMAKPLLNRYFALMRASRECCTQGIIYKMQQNKAKDSDIYEFLKEDANNYGLTSRCMVMSDGDFQGDYSHGVTGDMISSVRNSCLCKNRRWFDSLLEPFYDIYQMAPGFEYTPFFYTYLDGMQREVTVSVNEDVQNVMDMLGYCPD